MSKHENNRLNYTISAAEDGRYIRIVVQGEIERHHGILLIRKAHALGNQLDIDCYYMDLTNAVNVDSSIDQYQFANVDVAEAEGVNRDARVAVQVDPADHSHDYIETVCRNVGLNLRLVTSHEEAMAFLRSGMTEKN
jgi:hypothetical protein